ncbi:MAG: DNA polymerase III subunit delta [Candidatus Gracilibacteria bacterium]
MKKETDSEQGSKRNILFFTGDNLPAISDALHKEKLKFIETCGDLNINEFHVDEIGDAGELKSSLYAMPFLSDKRLVIIKGFPFSSEFVEQHKKDSAEKKKKFDHIEETILQAFTDLPEQTMLVLSSPRPDGRRKASKETLKIAKVLSFSVADLVPLMEERFKDVFTKQQLTYIFQRVGENPHVYISSLEKLALYSETHPLTKEVMFRLVPASIEEEVFSFIEVLFSKRRQEALKIFEQLIVQGENILKLLGLIVWQLEQVFFVKELMERRIQRQEILDITGIKPFSYQKVLPLAQKVSLKDIAKLYESLVHFDRKLKNGTIQMERDVPTEVIQGFSEVILKVF